MNPVLLYAANCEEETERGHVASVGGTTGAIKLVAVDEVMTFGWVFCASTLGAATTIIASLLGLN
ncbi:hypothetical protein CRG98_041672 [Punica granatum]|uniref:Uncharacterized protein n=1 Tax=Punica granatum TaxID=22663 RepID=A0A2I0I1U3_PUNGR|nr:hypothetical protein CRG98_041672 [Punica granatum]